MSTQRVISDIAPGGIFERMVMPPAFVERRNATRFKQQWTLSKFLYRCLMLGWNGEGDPKQWFMQKAQTLRKQAGFIGVRRGAISGGGGSSVVLTNHTLSDTDLSGTARAYWSFETDGTLWGFRNVFSDVEYSGEWWALEPVVGVGSSYAARHLSSGKVGTFNYVEAAVADAWATMSANRQWGVERTTTGSTTCTATFEVGPAASGPADDSAILFASASLEP